MYVYTIDARAIGNYIFECRGVDKMVKLRTGIGPFRNKMPISL